MISGGFFSGHEAVNPVFCRPFLQRGYTVFTVVHGSQPSQFKSAFGPRSDTAEERQKPGREISPIYFVHSNMPRILIIHGDADTLMPIYQARQFANKRKATGLLAKLVVREGKNHVWEGIEKGLEISTD